MNKKTFSIPGCAASLLSRLAMASLIMAAGTSQAADAGTSAPSPGKTPVARPVLRDATRMVNPTLSRNVLALAPATGSNIVRGYLAAAVGRSPQAESGGLYTRTIGGKDIYLPGVTVFLQSQPNPKVKVRSKRSASARTDLSGRFTLYAPEKGRYNICWESKVYGRGCAATPVTSGAAPQFVSTVDINVPRKEGFVAIMGHVTSADGSIPRVFDPLLNINAFPMVGLDDEKGNRVADVYVNNYGDYLMPYVPVKQKFNLTASIESARFSQEVRPEANIGVAPLSQINLKFENNRPKIDSLVALDAGTGRRAQNAAPGSKIIIAASARDKDGDAVKFAWYLDPSEGQLSQTSGPSVEWQLPSAPGRHSVTVVAYDGKGGYDRSEFSVLADGRGVPFSGVVVNPGGAPIAGAAIDIVGNPGLKTDVRGRFDIRVKESDRYVFNVRKEGYALNSQIYSKGMTGGRWILRPGQVVSIDPTRDVTIAHQRGERDCMGPDFLRAGVGATGNAVRVPQWQDGSGNAIDPPTGQDARSPVAGISNNLMKQEPATGSTRQFAMMPGNLKAGKCGPGVTVRIPANSILDAGGKPATAPFNVTVATVDLLSPQQMPGDDSVVSLDGRGGSIESFGAGSLDLPQGFKLRPGATAGIAFPVDRLRSGSPLPASVPLLSYDERKGLWVEEDKLTLATVNGVQSYTGNVRHFTTYNADTFFTNAACLRVISPTLPANYNLEVMSPFPDGTPHYKNYPIDNSTVHEHVIYNITPHANMTLAPMTQGTNPQLLGFYVVNSGGPEVPPHSPNPPPEPPPYTSCQNFVVLKAGSAPDSPSGGEFLHGIGFVNAVNLGFDDLTAQAPGGNALINSVVQASKDYYTQVDPGGSVDTLVKFKAKYGLGTDPNVPAAGEIVATYANSGDLGFGRDLHCRNNGGDIGCYVTNYGSGYTNNSPGTGTPDQDDADAAASATDGSGVSRVGVNASTVGAAVAMEYATVGGSGARVVKFFIYKNNQRSISANLDGRGERPAPQLCMICHGGQLPNQPASGVPTFNSAADVNLNARFLPFDYRFFIFPASAPQASQDANIKSLNKNIVDLVPTGAPASDPIREVVKALYDDGTVAGSSAQILNSPVSGWKPGQSLNLPGQTNLYNQVVANTCRTCHIAQPYPQLQFNTSDSFVNLSGGVPGNKLMLGTVQARVCGDYVMPHALRTHDVFWDNPLTVPGGHLQASLGISMPLVLQAFGDGVGGSTWKPGLCTTFITNPPQPHNYYGQVIQPMWNGKCVSCHVVGGIAAFLQLTEGLSYGNLVPAKVVPGNDNPNAVGNNLLKVLSYTDSRDPNYDPTNALRMPLNCVLTPPLPGELPCLTHSDIDKIKVWVRNGAN